MGLKTITCRKTLSLLTAQSFLVHFFVNFMSGFMQ